MEGKKTIPPYAKAIAALQVFSVIGDHPKDGVEAFNLVENELSKDQPRGMDELLNSKALVLWTPYASSCKHLGDVMDALEIAALAAVMCHEELAGQGDEKLPDGDYEIAQGGVWLGSKKFSIRVVENEEGVVMDCYSRGKEGDSSPVASTWAHNNDADDEDDSAESKKSQSSSPDLYENPVIRNLQWLHLSCKCSNFCDGRDRKDDVSAILKAHKDWRLPSSDELEAYAPSGQLDKDSVYWSSSAPVEGMQLTDEAWAFNAEIRDSILITRSTICRVVLVRDVK